MLRCEQKERSAFFFLPFLSKPRKVWMLSEYFAFSNFLSVGGPGAFLFVVLLISLSPVITSEKVFFFARLFLSPSQDLFVICSFLFLSPESPALSLLFPNARNSDRLLHSTRTYLLPLYVHSATFSFLLLILPAFS